MAHNRYEDLWSDLDDAVHATVHDYVEPLTGKRGAVALAPRMAMSPGTLSNKANPQMPDHKLGLVESIPLQLVTGEYAILHSYARTLGHCAWPLPPVTAQGDVELLDTYADMHVQAGAVARTVRAALADRRITAAEIAAIRQAFDAQVRAGLAFLARFDGLAE